MGFYWRYDDSLGVRCRSECGVSAREKAKKLDHALDMMTTMRRGYDSKNNDAVVIYPQ